MNDTEKMEFEELKRKVQEMTLVMQSVFNPDGTIKQAQLITGPKDTATTSATGVVRVETNLGPINVLVA